MSSTREIFTKVVFNKEAHTTHIKCLINAFVSYNNFKNLLRKYVICKVLKSIRIVV